MPDAVVLLLILAVAIGAAIMTARERHASSIDHRGLYDE